MIRIICALFLFLTSMISATEDISTYKLGTLPLLYNGRVQPLDSVARYALITIQEKTKLKRQYDNKEIKVHPTEWLWQVFCHDPLVYDDPIFLIHDMDIKHDYELMDTKKRFSYTDLLPHMMDIQTKGMAYAQLDTKTVYEKNMVQLASKLSLFTSLLHTFIPYNSISFNKYATDYINRVKDGLTLFNQYNTTGEMESREDSLKLIEFNQDFKRHQQFSELSSLYLFPHPTDPNNLELWRNTGSELLSLLDFNTQASDYLLSYAQLTEHYVANDHVSFNQTLDTFHNTLLSISQSTRWKILLEYSINVLNPFYVAMVLYIVSCLFMLGYYLFHTFFVHRVATWMCYSAFSIHTVALILRMIIQGRPPVTNLYSSAVFVGWIAIALCLLQERIFKLKVGNIVAGILGFLTLIVAHHLYLQGDTMEQMQAVLDSNFWLSTHVVTITLGYGGTFLAGTMAIIYVFKMMFGSMNQSVKTSLYKMVYGIICFSLFFSFIGTILGGIWADQSWGRFWGWDPKENGALLIVLWNALMLHSRLAGIVGFRGFMLLAIFGNSVTAFSWFGVNMLGVGLHSYGFMDSALQWLVAYCVSQYLIIILGLVYKKR